MYINGYAFDDSVVGAVYWAFSRWWPMVVESRLIAFQWLLYEFLLLASITVSM